jgi:hypothetical protein
MDGGPIEYVPVGSTNATPTTLTYPGALPGDSIYQFTVDATNAYIIGTLQGYPSPAIFRVGLDGQTPPLLIMSYGEPNQVLVDAANIYWSDLHDGSEAIYAMAIR